MTDARRSIQVNDSCERFRRWFDCLLDPSRTPGEQRKAACEWCEWGLDLLDVDETGLAARPDAFSADSRLPTGKAISPLGAARCLREYRRTAVLLQAMDAALRSAREQFPGERIHVLEAGCGPLAPLSLPFAVLYPPEEVAFTLLDLHPIALDGARRVVDGLGVSESIRAYLAADATAIRFSEPDRPHVIACEVLLRALTREPQVAATLNLAPQLRRCGLFLPERIDVDAGLFDQARWTRALTNSLKEGEEGLSSILDLGRVFSLDAYAVDRLETRGDGRFAAASVNVPPHDPGRTPLHLFTRIRVLGDHRLGDFDSSLNLPERVNYPAALAVEGGIAEFYYEVSADPGLRLAFPPRA